MVRVLRGAGRLKYRRSLYIVAHNIAHAYGGWALDFLQGLLANSNKGRQAKEPNNTGHPIFEAHSEC